MGMLLGHISDKCNTNLEGIELWSGSTLVSGQTLVHPFRACTRVWPDTCVDTRPRSPLLVGIVYVPAYLPTSNENLVSTFRLDGDSALHLHVLLPSMAEVTSSSDPCLMLPPLPICTESKSIFHAFHIF